MQIKIAYFTKEKKNKFHITFKIVLRDNLEQVKIHLY